MTELRNRLKRARHMASAIRAKHGKDGLDFEWDRANEVVKEINAVLALDDEQYEQGYENGESSVSADWHFALTEYGGFADDFDCTPMKVAQEIARLRALDVAEGK